MVEETTLYALRCYARACLIPQPHTRTPKRMLQPVAGTQKKVQLSTAALIWGPATAKMHIFTWESATAKKKVKKVQLSTDTLIWEPATAKKRYRRCSLQVSHFHLGACHRKNVKNIQLAAVTFSPGSLPPQKKGKEGLVFNCHTHLGACHRKNVKNRQLAAVTFSPGSLPPPKKRAKKVQLSTATLIWEPATAKTSRISSLQLSHFHLGACHRKKR